MTDRSTEQVTVFDALFAALLGEIVVAVSFAAMAAPGPGLIGGNHELGYIVAVAAAFYFMFAAMNVAGEWILRLGERDAAVFAPVSVFVAVFYVFGTVAAILFSSTASAEVAWWKLMIVGMLGAAAMFAYPLSREPVLASDMRQAWRGIIGKPVDVTCPQTKATATIMYDARTGWIQSCSRWPKHYTCARTCIARRSPTGAPPGSRTA
jgi:hypothetical protein